MAKHLKVTENRQPLDFGELTPERLNDALRTFGGIVACAAMPGPPAGGTGGLHDQTQVAVLREIVERIEAMAVEQAAQQLVTLAAQLLLPGIREALGSLPGRQRSERPFAPGNHMDWLTDWRLSTGTPEQRKEFRRQRIAQAWAEMRWFRPTLPDLPGRSLEELCDGKSTKETADFDNKVFETTAALMSEIAQFPIASKTLRAAWANDPYRVKPRAGLPSGEIVEGEAPGSDTGKYLPSGDSPNVATPPAGDIGLFFRAPLHFVANGGLELTLLRAFGPYLEHTKAEYLARVASVPGEPRAAVEPAIAAQRSIAENEQLAQVYAQFVGGAGVFWLEKARWISACLAAAGGAPNRILIDCAGQATVVELAGGSAVSPARATSKRQLRVASGAKGGKSTQRMRVDAAGTSATEPSARESCLPSEVTAAIAFGRAPELSKREKDGLAAAAKRKLEEEQAVLSASRPSVAKVRPK